MRQGGVGIKSIRREPTATESSVAALARDAMARGLAALPGNVASALGWLERAHRLLPLDPNTTLTLASVCLADDPARAASLFESVCAKYDVRQAWLGLAAARLRLAGADGAMEPLSKVLSGHGFQPDAASLADAVFGQAGWCALRSDGRLEIHAAVPVKPNGVRVLLDGRAVRGKRLPVGWESGLSVDVRCGGVPLAGSPIEVRTIRRLAGGVEVHDGGISGWAWHPAAPDLPPTLELRDGSGRLVRRFIARDETGVVGDHGPLARPRSFRLTRADLADVPGLVHVTGPDGRDLPGSPLDRLRDEAASVAAARWLGYAYPAAAGGSGPVEATGTGGSALRADGPVPVRPVGAVGRKRGVTIVIPVHDGGATVLACLDSTLASVAAGIRVLVVDDGSSDAAVVAALDDLVRRRKIALLRHPAAQGFPAAANAGIRAARGRDVVLLNSDTLVPAGWIERLRGAAYASLDIGTVTPLSNDASILSYPGAAGSNPRPDQAATTRLDRAAARANGDRVVDIPVGVGFCLYLRRDCLDAVGAFRAEVFAQGYGEENDLCLRARSLGWRNVALTGLFVGHAGGASFGASAAYLRDRNSRIVERLHPGYHAMIGDYLADDPLAEARRRIDLQLWRERGRRWRHSAIMITHNDGGGVERRLIHSAGAHERAGRRPIVLRPAETSGGEAAVAVRDGAGDDFPNLIYAMPRELPGLLRLLRSGRPAMIEAHHLADHPSAIYDLVRLLGVPYDVHVHDYAWFCPRVSLVGAQDRYCGEPDLPECETCVTDNGHFLKEDITVAALRRRSAAFLAGARRVVVPSEDTGIRMRRHFDGLATMTVPHEDDGAIPAAVPAAARRRPRKGGRAGVCVVGGIGVHKGYDIVLACARDADRRDLDLEFIVVGHTIDDARMMATGRVFVTGRFEPDEAVDLIAGQDARLGFIASICPETWCLSLGDIWRAGLDAAAFDIGAPAERIRNTGRGILLPLGLPASAINNALVAAMWTAAH